MGGLYFTPREGVKVHKLAGDGLHVLWTLANMGTSAIAIGRRLAAFHVAEGVTQAEVCRAISVAENRYSQYVHGKRKLPVDIALKLRAEYGLTTDWLFAGDPSALPAKIHAKLARIAAA